MTRSYEIRADYNLETITVYQAYGDAIADAAIANGRFVAPFSFGRMTWIKPSFLWLMARSNWGTRKGQERTLAVRIRRAGWERALSLAVPTDPTSAAFATQAAWQTAFDTALVHVQWDTERSIRGAGLPCYSIQVGLSRHVIREYVETWVTQITDVSERVRKIRSYVTQGQIAKATNHLPPEKVYPLAPALAKRIGADA